MTIDIAPCGERILTLAPVNEAEHKVGGLIVPQSVAPLAEVRVVATGPGRITDGGALVKPEVQVGQTVLINRSVGQEIERGGEKYRLLNPYDILAVVGD
jgi:chaperonin GroES